MPSKGRALQLPARLKAKVGEDPLDPRCQGQEALAWSRHHPMEADQVQPCSRHQRVSTPAPSDVRPRGQRKGYGILMIR